MSPSEEARLAQTTSVHGHRTGNLIRNLSVSEEICEWISAVLIFFEYFQEQLDAGSYDATTEVSPRYSSNSALSRPVEMGIMNQVLWLLVP